MKFTEAQKNFIKENFEDKVDEIINDKIDTDLIYYDDVADAVNRFANIVNCLRGEYTMDDLYSDLYEEYYKDDFDDIATEIYDEYLDEEQQKEVDEI